MQITDKDIFMDIETFSEVDIKTGGARKYAEDPSFDILLFSYAIGTGDVVTLDLTVEEIPEWLVSEILNDNSEYTFHAWNAAFERYCLSMYFAKKYNIKYILNPTKWKCTMILSAYCGLPASLDKAGAALDIDAKKLNTGKDLIKYFSIPCKATKVNGGRTRNMPEHDIEKWLNYKTYNRFDVEAEREIFIELPEVEIPQFERELYILDQLINDNGILVDLDMAAIAADMDITFKQEITENIKDITGLDNVNSPTQLKQWLNDRSGLTWELTKDAVKEYLGKPTQDRIPQNEYIKTDKDAREVLEGRQILSKTSTKKYDAMLACTSTDGRAKGLFQFYGANRTGRFAGRLIQLQNLPQNHLQDLSKTTDFLEVARNLVLDGEFEGLELVFGNVTNVLSQLIRTALIAPEGQTFAVADFSAIEARVLAYIAGETWRLEVFETHGKIYEASASKMFHVPIESVTKGSDMRQKGKVAELALGYGGADQALLNMGAEAMGLEKAERTEVLKAWRKANPHIVNFWQEINTAALDCVALGFPTNVKDGLIKFEMLENDNNKEWLALTLPSGRQLMYFDPIISTGRFGGNCVSYLGTDTTTNAMRSDTYGGKLTENVVQAIARDLLALAMLRVHKAGYVIALHVHDEIAAEVSEETAHLHLEELERLMAIAPDWASDMPLAADGYITKYYKKA